MSWSRHIGHTHTTKRNYANRGDMGNPRNCSSVASYLSNRVLSIWFPFDLLFSGGKLLSLVSFVTNDRSTWAMIRLVTNFVKERRPKENEDVWECVREFLPNHQSIRPSLIYELLSTPECVLGEHEIETISRTKKRPFRCWNFIIYEPSTTHENWIG